MNGGEGAPTYSGYQQQELVPYETSTRLDLGNMYNATSVDSPSEAEVAVCFLIMKEGKGQERTTRGRARARSRAARGQRTLSVSLFSSLSPSSRSSHFAPRRARSRVLPRAAHRARNVSRARSNKAHGAWREASAHARRARARALALRAYLARARVGVSQTSGGGGRDGARGRTSNQWA